MSDFSLDNYNAIVFDFDMTLADTSGVIVDLLNETVELFGYKKKTYDEILPIVGNTHEIMLKHVSGEADPKKLEEMQEHYRKLCIEKMAERTNLFPGAESSLNALHSKGKPLGILSLKMYEPLKKSLDKTNITHYFDCILGGENVTRPKPAPDGLLEMSKRLGINTDDILYLGDSLVDEQASASAGIDFCAMLLGGTAKEQFDPNLSKRFFRSWQDFEVYL